MNDFRLEDRKPSLVVAGGWGTMLGCLGAGFGLAVVPMEDRAIWLPPPVAAILLLPMFLGFGGFGAALLSLPLSGLLRALHRAGVRRHLILHGSLLGIPFGLANLGLCRLFWGAAALPWTLPWILSAVGGGIGLGAGVAASIVVGSRP
jgi:hypothetical protein